ncbi:MAG: zinc ABC transporter substrate-binding protein [Firmicutes bacterium]|nr:zinc ABC transporter substrate-binding protein [Bacillota bacterium]
MIKKKIAAAMLAAMLVLGGGCGSSDVSTNSDTPKILCAAFAEYDWTRQILGENPGGLDLQLLNASGMDMHSYQPSVADMVKIADADLMIFTGGDSEFWIEDALESSQSEHRTHVEIMEIFEHNHKLADRYTADEHDDHDHDEHDDHDGHGHDHEPAGDEAGHDGHVHSTDEHLWLSLKMAPAFIGQIAESIAELDPDNADYYEANASTYIDKIRKLDAHFENSVCDSGHKTILFADRYPFKYLLEDYGLAHVAAFPGCSAETEASFETILTLSETVDTLGLDTVIVLHKSKPDLAYTVINNSANPGAHVLELNSMQSVTAKDIDGGAAWLDIMEENIEALTKALN